MDTLLDWNSKGIIIKKYKVLKVYQLKLDNYYLKYT